MRIRYILLCCFLVVAGALWAGEPAVVSVTTDDISLIYKVNPNNGRLYQSYLGKKLSFEEDIAQLPFGKEAYLTHGMEDGSLRDARHGGLLRAGLAGAP